MVEDNVSTHMAAEPVRRVILLGASNVTLGLSTVIATAQRAWGAPLDIMAAIGCGRSYGTSSTVLGRTLPGILQCGLWADLQRRPPLPTAALVTDIGNDIIYGRDLDMILRWVQTCLERLHGVADRLIVTRLPLASLGRAPDWRIRLLISLFFPSSRADYAQALAKAHVLDRQLLSFAGRYRAYVVRPQRAWYAWDPIHIAALFALLRGRIISLAGPTEELFLLHRILFVAGSRRYERDRCVGNVVVWNVIVNSRLRLPDGTTLSLY